MLVIAHYNYEATLFVVVCSPRVGEYFPSTPWQPPSKLINMAQTSIHFQPVKGGSEEHNQRTKKLDYVHHELSSQNDYWQLCSQESRLAFVADNAKAKTGRKMQAKATPIREAVVVIKDTTTMNDLKDLSKRLHDRFGIEVFQIAIHKDEGYKKSKDGIKLNLHAHLVADWTNHETGKSLKLNRNDMSEMQTLVAECLKMERGKSSEKQHLSAIQYKIAAEEQRAAEKAAEAQSYADVIQSARSDLHGLEAQRNALDAEIQIKAQEKKRAEKDAEEAKAKAKQAEVAALSGLVVGSTKKLGNLLGLGKEAKQLKELPQQLATAREEGRKEGIISTKREIFKATGLKIDSVEELDKMSPQEFGEDIKYLFDEDKKKATENEKKLQIISKMAEQNYTYDAAAKLIKDKYADMSFSYEKDLRNYAGSQDAFTFKDKVFDPLCERQGAHNVSTTDNAIGRREICAQGIVCACIRFFDSMKLDRLANTLKAMAHNFNLGEWRKLQEPTKMRNQEHQNQERKQGRGWHL